MERIIPQNQQYLSQSLCEESIRNSLLPKFRQDFEQIDIFDSLDEEVADDFERLRYCFEAIDMSSLINAMNVKRRNGRNDYPNEVMLKLVLAHKVFGHNSTAAFIRELERNRDLRKICGLRDADYIYGRKKKVPNAGAFTRFYRRLEEHLDELAKLQKSLLDYFYENIPGFGMQVAGDGKYIQSYAKNENVHADGDRRSENDACISTKKTFQKDANGVDKVKKTHFFGFRAHVLVDVKTGLPIETRLEKANVGEREVMEAILKGLETKPKYAMLDKGYEGIELSNELRAQGIIPIVLLRKMRKDSDGTQYKDTNIYYFEDGTVYYADPQTGETHPMKYLGYDKVRKAMRYSYKAKVYRLYLKEDPRVFNEVARGSKKFQRLYNGRTAVERYNARLDCDYGFEQHYMRNLATINTHVQLTNLVMLAMAKTHVEKGQTNYMSKHHFN